MKSTSFLVIMLLILTSSGQDSTAFKNLWYDGNAEISTYALKESRYGEVRNGTRVMVFVTEPMRIATHIKPDVKLPEDQMLRVIKLNDLRKFTTGIYEYSVMTSVFASVENKAPFENMNTMKISFSSQDWCGQVFDRIIRTPDTYKGEIFSYFESEGEAAYSFEVNGVETEDNLWIKIRELNGTFLNEGETRNLKLIQSRWITRKLHSPSNVTDASITKGKSQVLETSLGKINAVSFIWTIGNGTTTVHVEQVYPHRIVEFAERDGSSGKLIASQREPYWKKNSNNFKTLREKLKLPQ